MEKADKKITIAVDGFSSTGKSTIAKDIAKHYNIRYIDSGAMYRAVTLFALRNELIDTTIRHIDKKRLRESLENVDIDFLRDIKNNTQTITLNKENVEEQIRKMDVNNYVSHISSIGFVREKMVQKQREFQKQGSVVMDGRDIGTVVFPDADVKFFVVADKTVRARRRYEELKSKGQIISFAEVMKNIEERDRIDQNRDVSPLKKASDAIEFDNTNLSRDEQLTKAIEIIESR
ncbi:MAG: (d)CMP kinase [Bacteroidales bacterium]